MAESSVNKLNRPFGPEEMSMPKKKDFLIGLNMLHGVDIQVAIIR